MSVPSVGRKKQIPTFYIFHHKIFSEEYDPRMIRVLYVDDEPDLLEIAKLFLEATGDFSLETATSAQDGLAALTERVFDAVVSDYQMPIMNGIGFLKEIRAKYEGIPFILFTGRGREEVVIEAINNGSDFYVQKGGDPKAQFAELAHKIRQAVARRTAEKLHIDSEKRLSDIINFLPDPTFAIDTAGTVIAWNRAMEEMTGIAASRMTGKGNYEYALPFYGERLPMLIDLVFATPGEISKRYSHVQWDGPMLAAESELSRVNGRRRTLWGKASPLYDRNGQITGSIESIRDITERKEAEETLSEKNRLLSESESQLKRAEIVAGIGHWEYHLETGMMIGSENACAIYGVEGPVIPILTVQKIPLPEYRGELDAALGTLIRKGIPYAIDFRIQRPADGALRDIHSIATFDPKKKVVFGIIQDITERKKVENELAAANEQLAAAEEELRGQYESLAENQKALAGSEEKYRAILENIQDVYYRTDTQGILTMISPSGARLLGYANPQEMLGKPATFFYADPEQRTLLLADLQEKGFVSNREISLKRKDGSLVTVSTSSHAYSDATGNYLGVEGIFRDISDLKQTEEALRENEENFHRMVESAPDAIYIAVGERFVYVNPAMVGLVGASSADELVGTSLFDRIDPSYHDAILKRMNQVTKERKPVGRAEIVYLKMDGTPVPVESAVALIEFSGEPGGLVIIRDVTERKKAVDALQESEKKYRTVIETTGTGFVMLDGRGRVMDANREYVRLTGHTDLSEIAGKNIIEWTAEHDRDKNLEAFKRCNEEGHVRNLEIDYIDGSGKLTPIEINASLIHYSGEVRILTLCLDITERKRAIAALQESEKKYRDMFDINNAVMFIVDPESGIIIDANAAACRYYGYTRDEFAGLSILAINVQDLDITMADMADARVNRGEVFHFRHRKKDGEIRTVNVYSAPIIQGGRQYLHSIIQDVTDQERAEEALRDSEQKFRDIFNNTTDAIHLHEILPDGSPGNFSDVNDVACRMLGYTREEMLVRSPNDITTSHHTPPQTQTVSDQKTTGRARFETEHIAKDGTIIPVEINTQVVTIQKRKVVVAVVRDITERKRAEEAIRLANKKLNLLSGITRHDIGNQLTALFQYIDLSKMMVQDPILKSTIEKEETIAHNIQRQVQISREYDKLGSGAPEWQNVKKSIDLGAQGHDLDGINLDTGNTAMFEILADSMLQKVFFNLIDNSLRHSGDSLTFIRFVARESETGLTISCEDDGPGIPAYQKLLIFERGWGKNTGFGLFFIREILSITGISISEKGESGKGARFEIQVPPGGYRWSQAE